MTEGSINISKWTWPPGSPSVLQSLPVTGIWLTYPTPYPKFLQPMSRAALLPDVLPYIILPFWLPGPFVYPLPTRSLGPGQSLGQRVLSPFPPFLSSHGPALWPCPLWILPDVHASGHALPYIYNKCSPSPHPGAVRPFPVYFFFPFRKLLRKTLNINLWPPHCTLTSTFPLHYCKPSTVLQANPNAQERCF